MRVYFDLDLRQLVTGLGVKTPIAQLYFTRGDAENLEVQFTRNGVVQDPGCDSVFFVIKPTGEYDGDALVLHTDFTKTGSGTTALWTGQPNFNNAVLDEELGVGGATDVASLAAAAEVGFVVSGRQTTSRSFRCVIENDLYRGSEMSPSAFPAGSAPTFYPTLTALTGGVDSLDSLPTAAIPTGVIVQLVVSGELQSWQLVAGTDAEDVLGGIVRGDDYASGTNEKFWSRVS